MRNDVPSNDRDQLESTKSLLRDLDQQVTQARTTAIDGVRQRVASAGKTFDSLADCTALVHQAGTYAAAAQTLADLGEYSAAEIMVAYGQAYVEVAQECLDGL